MVVVVLFLLNEESDRFARYSFFKIFIAIISWWFNIIARIDHVACVTWSQIVHITTPYLINSHIITGKNGAVNTHHDDVYNEI